MTLDEALEVARELSAHRGAHGIGDEIRARSLAQWVAETLGVAFPCGYTEPKVNAHGLVKVDSDITVTVEEARGFVASMLRACDRSDAYEADDKAEHENHDERFRVGTDGMEHE